jgi:hypothetical protein
MEGPSTFQKRETGGFFFVFVSIRRPSVDFDLKKRKKKKSPSRIEGAGGSMTVGFRRKK